MNHFLRKYVTGLGHAMGLYDDQYPVFALSNDYEYDDAIHTIIGSDGD